MTIINLLLILLSLAATIAATIAASTAKNRKQRIAELETLNKALAEKERETAARLSENEAINIRNEVVIETLRREIGEANRQREADESRFGQIAKEVLSNQFSQIKTDNESRLLELLVPFREQIDNFKHQVETCYSNESRERFALKSEIERLLEQSRTIGKEAQQLSNALRGNSKAQGDWGELILENILEKSGLRRGVEFVLQQTRDIDGSALTTKAGTRLRPDAVVYYPGRRAVVVDSKVSLTAFTAWANAENDDERQKAGKAHVDSIRKHIDELSRKRYEDYVSDMRLDFVLMFIPNEAAYMAAMSLEPNLWQEAYDSHVLIVSPTHLISVLRIISQLWIRNRQTKNAVEIADKAGRLYDKFANFVKAMEEIQKGLTTSQRAYDLAMNRLCSGSGNLLGKAQELKELGAKARTALSVSSNSSSEEEPRADHHD